MPRRTTPPSADPSRTRASRPLTFSIPTRTGATTRPTPRKTGQSCRSAISPAFPYAGTRRTFATTASPAGTTSTRTTTSTSTTFSTIGYFAIRPRGGDARPAPPAGTANRKRGASWRKTGIPVRSGSRTVTEEPMWFARRAERNPYRTSERTNHPANHGQRTPNSGRATDRVRLDPVAPNPPEKETTASDASTVWHAIYFYSRSRSLSVTPVTRFSSSKGCSNDRRIFLTCIL